MTPTNDMTETTPSRSRRSLHACRRLALASCFVFAAGCAVGPDYKRPPTPVPAAFKEDPVWKTAAPSDGSSHGPWWEVFKDPDLDALASQVEASNENVRQAVANYEAAVFITRSDRTQYLPQLGGTVAAERSKPSVTQSLGTTHASSLYTAELQGSWAPDIWGKLRRTVEADAATATANEADLANARLSMQATLVEDYINLRATDDRVRLLENAVAAYARTLQISQNKYSVGVAARSDVITAQTQLDSTRAQLIDAGVVRAQYEHAIAVLIGRPPSDFTIERRAAIGLTLPVVPSQVPSNLLERRPDVAAAERLAMAANARIGIQVSAYFPTLSLTGTGGYEGSPVGSLFNAPFRFWTLGAQATDSILDWGQRHDLVQSARANYEASVASYRQTVLTALQQVEDNLSGLRVLRDEARVEDTAVTEAALASQIALNEYNAGTVDFTTVAAAQVTELTNRETLLAIVQSQMTSSVGLIEALGGGWSTADLKRP